MTDVTYCKLLVKASICGIAEVVKFLLENSADVNVQEGIYRDVEAAFRDDHEEIGTNAIKAVVSLKIIKTLGGAVDGREERELQGLVVPL